MVPIFDANLNQQFDGFHILGTHFGQGTVRSQQREFGQCLDKCFALDGQPEKARHADTGTKSLQATTPNCWVLRGLETNAEGSQTEGPDKLNLINYSFLKFFKPQTSTGLVQNVWLL